MTTEIGAALPSWAVRILGELDAADESAKDVVRGLTPEQLNRRPAPGVWSVGQCLEHLCVSGEVYLPPIQDSLAGKPMAPVQEIVPGWFGRWFLRNYIEPSPRSKRTSAPRKIAPGSQVDASILDRFLRVNQAARQLVRQGGSHDVNRIRFKNPLVPVIRFTVGTGFLILSGHERRHLLQAEGVKRSLNLPD